MLKRKLKKLIRDPKLFISDMMINNAKKKELINIKVEHGNYSYTVVSAVYNSGIYLDDYFKSFIKQNLNFKKNIQLILVDDGSSDNSAEIIKKWKSKYPDNIKYFYKENGGQASARNLGLSHVTSDWVTFIDSDDFVSSNYFSAVDELIAQNNNLKMVCCNQIYYFEEENTYIDRHPLNYRFKDKKTILPLSDLGRNMQFSAPLAFFHVASIPESLLFDVTLKPTFEDGKFVAHYILANQSSNICFYEVPKYYNRKRSDKSSTMDNAWFNKGQYGVVLENGYIPTFKNYLAELGHIPKFMQRTILWEMLRLVKHLVNQEHNVSFLSNDEKEKFLSLMDETFKYIDSDTILSFELGSCGFSRQVGMLGCFKKEAPSTQVVYIEKYDSAKKLLLVRYFTCKQSLEHFDLDGVDLIPAFEKVSARSFLSRDFLLEKRMWLPINEFTSGELSIKIDNKPTSINYFGKKYKGKINISNLTKSKPLKNEIWLLMDRDDSAGDNAEFLYEFCQKNTDVEIYFVLNKKSPDWNRLHDKGFNLIEHESLQHRELLTKCTRTISSHIGPMINPFPDLKVNFSNVFLQHGVTKDNISGWINNCTIDLMITASNCEFEEIVKPKSPYIYGAKEIKLTGFPRFDSLIDESEDFKKKKILIMPTWRKSISGVFVKKGSSERIYNDKFIETTYAKAINSLLSSSELKDLANKYNFEVVFCPHPNMRPYINSFVGSECVSLASPSHSIQKLLKESSLLITDYSSVAFDFAYMKKPICYYQFDENEFFSGEHTYGKGYYDYRRNGFGPVVNTEAELINEIFNIAKDNFSKDLNPYSSMVDTTFSHIDSNNSERVFNAIIDMEKSVVDMDVNILEAFAEQASSNKNWNLAVSRWGKLLSLQVGRYADNIYLKLVEALREDGRVNESIELLNKLILDDLVNFDDVFYIEQAKSYMVCQQWYSASVSWSKVSIQSSSEHAMYAKCLSEIKNVEALNKHIMEINPIDSSPLYTTLIARQQMAQDNWNDAIEVIEHNLHFFSQEDRIMFKPELILSRCYRQLNDHIESHNYLTKYENYAKSDIQYRYEIVQLAYKAGSWNKVITQFDRAAISNIYLSSELNLIYLEALLSSNKYTEALALINLLPVQLSDKDDFKIIKAKSYSSLQNWNEAAVLWLQLISSFDEAYYELAKAYRMLGMIEEAIEVMQNQSIRNSATIHEWQLRYELAHLISNWKEAEYCMLSIIRNFPGKVTDISWDKLYKAQLMNTLSSSKIDVKLN